MFSRRNFLKAVSAGLSWPLVTYPRCSLAASDRLHIAAVGVGGKGRSDIAETSAGQNVVAICDVDQRQLDRAHTLYPGAKTYSDWRKMLEQSDIDAVTVSTPDHMHSPIATAAMQLGKHVYVQKPMAHTVSEARSLKELARTSGVVTQMGNQNHSGSNYRTVVQVLQSGVLGKIREAHTWSNRPIWPQGIDRPAGADPVPEWLDWDVWLGVAPDRPYLGPGPNSVRDRGVYHPFNWRGWLDFGVGALGDMGCHIMDPVVWGLELAGPLRVWSDGPASNGETYPKWGIIHYEFPGTQFTAGDTFRMTWYDGGKQPAHELTQLPPGEKLPSSGSLYIGEKGVMLSPHGAKGPTLLPAEGFRDYDLQLAKEDNHYLQWTNACKGEGETSSSFDYAGPLTETVLLGTIAIRFPGQTLDWDETKMQVTNVPAANQYVAKEYRVQS